MTPGPYTFVLLALASYRTWRLIASDDATYRLRAWLVRWDENVGVPRRPLVAEWLYCPWCSGFWYTIAWFGVWMLWSDVVVVAAVLAGSAVVGLIRTRLDPDEGPSI
jgi:hypothetical protein